MNNPELEDLEWRDFLKWESASCKIIKVNVCYVDLAGDLVAGVLLSQIVYWHLNGKNGVCRLSVERDGKMWLAKKMEDWWDECRLTVRQAKRALDTLEARGLIETGVFHFKHLPVKHVRINQPVFLNALSDLIAKSGGLPKTTERQFANSPNVILKSDETSDCKSTKGVITYSTESTSREYKQRSHSGGGANVKIQDTAPPQGVNSDKFEPVPQTEGERALIEGCMANARNARDRDSWPQAQAAITALDAGKSGAASADEVRAFIDYFTQDKKDRPYLSQVPRQWKRWKANQMKAETKSTRQLLQERIDRAKT